MVKKKHYGLDYCILILLAAAILVLLSYMLRSYQLNRTVEFSPDLNVVDNPMMGYAPNGENINQCADTNLVFIKLRWADWEPEMGQYDTDFLETTFHTSRWREAGKHAVLRFICDEPGEAYHVDIPQWLLEETNDGTYYTGSSGAGYSPNYENPYFISRHAMAIGALADYFSQDTFLAYVELGSLGHWGEWHARDGDGNSLMPPAETCGDYIRVYRERFHNVGLLMRRSYSDAVEGQLGLYNDMLGDRQETDRWLSWTTQGGTQETGTDHLEILPYDAFWECAPAGGEFTSSQSSEILYGQGLPELLGALESCHLTFVGPMIPDREAYPSAYDAVLRRLGYHYYVSRLTSAVSFADDSLNLQLDWENPGAAPLYWDWPVVLKVFDGAGTLVYWETLDLELSRLYPGTKQTTNTKVPLSDSLRDGFSVGISIRSEDGRDRVLLSMDAETTEDCQIIYSTKDDA